MNSRIVLPFDRVKVSKYLWSRITEEIHSLHATGDKGITMGLSKSYFYACCIPHLTIAYGYDTVGRVYLNIRSRRFTLLKNVCKEDFAVDYNYEDI